MSEKTNKRKTKDKNFYAKAAKIARKSAGDLGPDMRGFLCTCQREKEGVRDAYNILNEHIDLLYGNETMKTEAQEGEKLDLEIEDELSKEVAQLKNERAKPIAERRLQSVQTGVKGCIFIRSTVEDPFKVVQEVISKIEKTQLQATKFLQRLYPIEATCKANVDEIVKTAERVIGDRLDTAKTFSLLVKVRFNGMKREQIIEPMAEMVQKKNPSIKVHLDDPDVSVVAEVLKGTCCIGLITNYAKHAKYNLIELVQKKEGEVGKTDCVLKKDENAENADLVLKKEETAETTE